MKLFSFFTLGFLLLLSSIAHSQENFDAYAAEDNAYFTMPIQTPYGVVFSDNYYSSVNLYNGSVQTLFSYPGCGRYLDLSENGRYIGFKKIIQNGMQIPVLYDISSGKESELYAPAVQCGQVSVTDNGLAAFTVGNDLFVTGNIQNIKADLGEYINIVKISSDGKSVAYTNGSDQLVVLELSSLHKQVVSDSGDRCIYPVWSPDSRRIVYKTMDGLLKVYDISDQNNYTLGEGGSPDWSKNSDYVIFHREKAEDLQFLGSDIFIARFDGTGIINLTNTESVNEMHVSFASGNTILFHTYNRHEILRASLNSEYNQVSDFETVLGAETVIPVVFHDKSNFRSKSLNAITVIDNVPYVHQKYDTPDWHNGSGSCAPTTCSMALAFYNLLPKWPKTVSSPYAHTSNYGYYVADKYRFNELYYDTYESAYGTDAWGGYGYMWGNGSPNSMQRSYIENHKLTSNQLWSSSCTFQQSIDEVNQGYVHPLCVMLTSSGHLILTRGYVQGQHTLIFNDPYGDKNTPGYPSYDGELAYYDWPGYNNGYENLDYNGSYGIIAWSTRARGSEPVYNDTLIDDIYYNHGFHMNNSEDGSHQRYFHDGNVGYDGHTWWTYTMATDPDIAWVTWTPNLPESAEYEVFAYIPSNYATAQNAIYRIHHSNGTTVHPVNQSLYFNEWVSLGTYTFQAGQSGMVYLGDSTGTDSEMIAFDAVKFSKIAGSVQMVVSNVTCNGNHDGSITAVPLSGAQPFSYSWNNGGSSSVIAGLAPGDYSVTVTDAIGITTVGSAIITEPSELVLNSVFTDPTIAGGSDGTISTNPAGGDGNYSYSWIPAVSTTNVAAGLSSGTYSVTVQDGNGCSASDTYTLNDPFCDAPSSILVSNITSASADISWAGIQGVLGYLFQFKKASDLQWTSFTLTQNSIQLTGLAADSTYFINVYTLCGGDTSAASTSQFTTLPGNDYTLSGCKGDVYDSGGDNGLYSNDEDYLITISPAGAERIRLAFESFATEATFDFLYIYDGDTATGSLIGVYDGETAGDSPGNVVAETGLMTLHFVSDYSQVRDGWSAHYIADGGQCGLLPLTAVDTLPSEWKTADFEVSYTDTDLNGFGLSEMFYQPLFWDGDSWHANTDGGFMNDNYEGILDTAYTSVLGTWGIVSGHLEQSDEVEANTNIHIPVVQESGSIYLYQWSMLIDGAGTNRRAGIHFFCDNPGLTQRGNSYMVYFRADQNKCQIYKSVNDVIDLYTDDNMEVLPGVWYDYKVLFNQSTGEISAYQNDKLVSQWFDQNPHSAGNSVSMRTGNCIARYDDFKIYRNRSNVTVVSVGANSDIKFQNTNPATPSCRIKSIVRDNLLHFSARETGNFNIDWTSPDDVLFVNDGLATDIDTTYSAGTLSASWPPSFDNQSDIKTYWFAIGTLPGADNVHPWTENGTDTALVVTGIMNLNNDSIYYVSVKAENHAGLFSNAVSSDGQLAILLPDVSFYADNTHVCAGESVIFTNGSQNGQSYQWLFEGANPFMSTAIEPNVQYSTEGVFDVTLIATGAGGTDTLEMLNYITVHGMPIADFSSPDTEVEYSNPVVIFTNNSYYADSYYWDFGDGSYSSDMNPYHIYSDTGYYSVSLVALSAVCSSDTMLMEDYIHVINTTGIQNYEAGEEVVFPNPAEDYISVCSDKVNQIDYAALIDGSGKETALTPFKSNGACSQFEIDRMTIAKGIYVLKTVEGEKATYYKIIIK